MTAGSGSARRRARFPFPLSLSLFPFVALACTAITVRPTYRPFPLAVFDTLTAKPDEIIAGAVDGIAALGLVVRVATPAEGYVETRWYDVEAHRSRRTVTDPDRTVRIRVWADLVAPLQSQVVIEAVRRRSLDPSVPEREDEAMVPPGSRGDSLAQALRRAIAARFGGDGPPAPGSAP